MDHFFHIDLLDMGIDGNYVHLYSLMSWKVSIYYSLAYRIKKWVTMQKNAIFSDPNLKKRQILNRYLDLRKFVDFLRTSELHLEPATNFDDHLEGTLPEAIRQSLCESPDVIERFGSIPILDLEYQNKNRTNLSCWTLGSKDNMALWKIYGGSTQSVVISTTVERMISTAFSWLKFGKIKLIRVRYVNHAGRLPNGVYALDENVFGLKHVDYSFEKEVRVVLTRPKEEMPCSIRLPVKIDQFLTKITVAPEAGDWFFNLVVYFMRKYRVPVKRSDLTFLINKAKYPSTAKGQPVNSADPKGRASD